MVRVLGPPVNRAGAGRRYGKPDGQAAQAKLISSMKGTGATVVPPGPTAANYQ